MDVHWKDWCWSWNSNILATWCEELMHLKRPWCWERLKSGGEGDDRGWSGWMTSLTQWTWVWVNSGSWWWTWIPGVLQSLGSQTVGHNWVIELNWFTHIHICIHFIFFPPNSPYWEEFLVLYSRFLLVLYFIYVCICQSQSPNLSPWPPSPGNHSLFSTTSVTLFCK